MAVRGSRMLPLTFDLNDTGNKSKKKVAELTQGSQKSFFEEGKKEKNDNENTGAFGMTY